MHNFLVAKKQFLKYKVLKILYVWFGVENVWLDDRQRYIYKNISNFTQLSADKMSLLNPQREGSCHGYNLDCCLLVKVSQYTCFFDPTFIFFFGFIYFIRPKSLNVKAKKCQKKVKFPFFYSIFRLRPFHDGVHPKGIDSMTQQS